MANSFGHPWRFSERAGLDPASPAREFEAARLVAGSATHLAGMAGFCEHGNCRWRGWNTRSQAVIEPFVRRHQRSKPRVAARLASEKNAPFPPNPPSADDVNRATHVMTRTWMLKTAWHTQPCTVGACRCASAGNKPLVRASTITHSGARQRIRRRPLESNTHRFDLPDHRHRLRAFGKLRQESISPSRRQGH